MLTRISARIRATLGHRAIWIAAVLVAIGAVAMLPIRAPARSPNIVMIVVDTLRADRLGVYGNRNGLTPFLDELAARGTAFANAYAPSSWTCPSVASLLTSRYASQHHVATFDSKLADAEVTLPEILTEQGYVAGGFSANFRLADSHGFGQGFRHWRTYLSRKGETKVRGGRLLDESRDWIRTTRASTPAPLFLYLQYMEPHSPYQPVEPYRSRYYRPAAAVDEAATMTKLNAAVPGVANEFSAAELDVLTSLYDGEVASVDAELRRLFGMLQSAGVLEDAIIVITADHGEEFGEHQHLLHGFTLYNTAIRVPLIVIAPGIPGGRVVKEDVSLTDIAPTILDLVQIPAAPTFEGHSLVPLLVGNGPPLARRAVLSELEPMSRERDWRVHSRALVSGLRKLLVKPNGNIRAYALERDPGERRGWLMAGTTRAMNQDLADELARQNSQLLQRAGAERLHQPLDEATREKLRALGYHP